MARGWESKSVESQMDDSLARSARSAPSVPPRDPAFERERDLLELSRKRLLLEIEHTADARLREIRQRALLHVESALLAHSAKKT